MMGPYYGEDTIEPGGYRLARGKAPEGLGAQEQQGWNQKEIANALGVTEGAVSQWMKRAREGGTEGLKKRTPPGAPPRLSEHQRAQLPKLLARGAKAYGFRGEVWTCERVAEVIREEFGVVYHPAHVSRVVRELGLSL